MGFARHLLNEVVADDVSGMAAEMAYRFLFALFPFALLIVSTFALVSDALGLDHLLIDLLPMLQPLMPDAIYGGVQVIARQLLEAPTPGFLSVGIIGTIWGAAGGAGTLIKGLNRAYDVTSTRAAWQRQLLAIAVTLSLPPIALALLLIGILGDNVVAWVGSSLRLGQQTAVLWELARWPVLAMALFLGSSVLYHLLPNTHHPYRASLPGSAVTAAGWLAATRLLDLYLSNLADYAVSYGSFGTAVAFLLWLYVTAFIVLVGAEVNGVLQSRAPQQQREDHPDERVTARPAAGR